MNLADLQTELNSMDGLASVPTGTRKLYLNEGYTELYQQSEWGRALVSVPTVAGQAAYAIPGIQHEGGERILEVWADGFPLEQSSEDQVRSIVAGEQVLGGGFGLYWISVDAASVEKVSIYPTPVQSGKLIEALVVPGLSSLTNPTDVPALPSRFHRAIVDYAASLAYGAVGNPEAGAYYQDRFTAKVGELFRLRMSRQGRGPIQMQVEGWHY